ncbi:YbaK/EbsC family protein [Streptomyces sp. NPDC057682]|uniref:YbaK/EbsC family protein n=1 Tax=Streptomyces sp. NPDC057682 TaxID=3346210 RepID=UPI0036CF491A
MELLASAPHPYRIVGHPPQGATDLASLLRGHPLRQAAKSLVIRVALPGKKRRYVLAVVRGDHRVDLGAVCAVAGGVRAGFADRATAERLTGCVSGSIVPFSFHPELDVVVDPALLEEDEIWFNAARLDQSVALSAHAYRALAGPRVAGIADRTGTTDHRTAPADARAA